MVYESFGISPDGATVTIATIAQTGTINLADRLPTLR
ncbi:MAG: hypothetical protein ACI8QZ_003682 [Chlamydiales bacterium]|jgi:hypothetical protein